MQTVALFSLLFLCASAIPYHQPEHPDYRGRAPRYQPNQFSGYSRFPGYQANYYAIYSGYPQYQFNPFIYGRERNDLYTHPSEEPVANVDIGRSMKSVMRTLSFLAEEFQFRREKYPGEKLPIKDIQVEIAELVEYLIPLKGFLTMAKGIMNFIIPDQAVQPKNPDDLDDNDSHEESFLDEFGEDKEVNDNDKKSKDDDKEKNDDKEKSDDKEKNDDKEKSDDKEKNDDKEKDDEKKKDDDEKDNDEKRNDDEKKDDNNSKDEMKKKEDNTPKEEESPKNNGSTEDEETESDEEIARQIEDIFDLH